MVSAGRTRRRRRRRKQARRLRRKKARRASPTMEATSGRWLSGGPRQARVPVAGGDRTSKDLDRSRQLPHGSGIYSWKDPGSSGEDWMRECAWHVCNVYGQDV